MEGRELPSFHDVLIDTLNHLELLKWLHSTQILETSGGSSSKRKRENNLNELGRSKLHVPEGSPSTMQERTTKQLVLSSNNPADIHGRVQNIKELFLLNNIRSMENAILTMKSAKLKDEGEPMLKDEGEQLCVPKKNSDSAMEKVFKLEALERALEAEAKERERLKGQKAALEKCLAYALNRAEEGIFMCNCCKEIVHCIEKHTECQNQVLQNLQSKPAAMNEFQSIEFTVPCENHDSCWENKASLYTKENVTLFLDSKNIQENDGQTEFKISDAAIDILLEPEKGEANEDVQVDNQERICYQSPSLDEEKILNGGKETEIEDFFAWSRQKILEMEMCESDMPDNDATDKGEQYDSLPIVEEGCKASSSAQYYIGATKDKGGCYESLHVVEKDENSVLVLELESDTYDDNVLT